MKNLLILALMLSGVTAFAVPTTLATVTVSETAAALADNAADTSNGNRVLNPNGDLFFVMRNSHGSNSSTVTITAQNTSHNVPGVGTVTKSNASVVLAAGAVKVIGPFPKKAWNDANGYVQLTYSGTGTVLVSPMRVPSGR